MTRLNLPLPFARNLTLEVAFLLVFLLAASTVWGQDPASVSPGASRIKPEPKKVWTEDDFARLLKPWDLYQIEQEKKSALVEAAPITPETPAPSDDAVLGAMDAREFNRFLKMFDTSVATWQNRLKKMDVSTLGVKSQEQQEIGKRYDSCLELLERIRNQITSLAQEQTLKLDLLLLIDLNALARNLDGLSVNLASPLTVDGTAAAHKFLGLAQEILAIDEQLAEHITEFQYHVLALACASDTALRRIPPTLDQAK